MNMNGHVVVKDAQKSSRFDIDDVHDGNESQAILLRIHGQSHKPGWRNVHTSMGEHVDHVLQLDNLKDFQDASVAAIYAEAQTLEEAPPSLGILQEWWRVLQPGGAFFLSAPDMKVLSAFLARDDLDSSERDALTELMFQRTAVDFDGLNATLNAAGFCDVEKVRGFGLFNDTSAVAFRGERLALNVVARACRKEGQAITVQFPGMET